MGRKPSTDKASPLSIYPPRSLRERLDKRADETPGATAAGLAVSLVRDGLDRLDQADKRKAKADA